MTLIQISWDSYQNLAKKIVEQLEQENYRPDLIVGIARGGLPPMVTISSYYKIRQVGVVFMQKTATDKEFSSMLPEAICHGYGIPFDVTDKNVLVTDNIVQSGQTLRGALKLVQELGAKSVRSVSICKHKETYEFSHLAPMEVESDDWVVFPWDQLT